jgi:hypothetical protein
MRNEKGQFIKGHKSTNVLGKGGYKKGDKPWNTGLKKPFTEEEIKAKPWLFTSEKSKGNTNGFKKGEVGYWTGKKRPEMVGNTNGFKVGNKVNLGRKYSTRWNKGKTAETDSRILTGENHPNWNDGITPINNKIRTSANGVMWRKAVLVRDNFTCQKYGVRGGVLCAHHINNFAEFPELRFAIDNGITLCEKAHKDFHHLYGVKNNTKEQLQEFLTS